MSASYCSTGRKFISDTATTGFRARFIGRCLNSVCIRLYTQGLQVRLTVEDTSIPELEAEIDRIVYDLFDLTDDEREVIEEYLDVF